MSFYDSYNLFYLFIYFFVAVFLKKKKKNKKEIHKRLLSEYLQKTEIVELQAEPSMHIQLAEKLNHQSNVFEMFTLTGYPDTEYTQHRNLFSMATKSRNMPRKARNSNIVLPEI